MSPGKGARFGRMRPRWCADVALSLRDEPREVRALADLRPRLHPRPPPGPALIASHHPALIAVLHQPLRVFCGLGQDQHLRWALLPLARPVVWTCPVASASPMAEVKREVGMPGPSGLLLFLRGAVSATAMYT